MALSVDETPEAINAIARPLRGEAQIDEIARLVSNKRIVLLGEATHGTHEFYDFRAALTRRLISEHGFAAVAVEGDWPDALRVDRYVRGLGDDEDAPSALDAFERFPRWMWRNEDVALLVDWMRLHNLERTEADRVGFYGLDIYSLHASMRAVIAYLDDNDYEAAARARARYACFDHVIDVDPQHYGMQAHLGLGPKCETEVVAQLVEMQLRKLARSGRSPDGDAWFHAVQQAHVVRNAEAYYRSMFAGRTESWNLRDTHMADTVDMVAAHVGRGAPAKLILWAHNSHVGDARATEMGDDGQITLGQLMRERHPGETALVGFSTHEGAVVAAHDWDELPEKKRVRPSLPGSWEHLFHQAESSRFYLLGSDLKRAVGENAVRLQRAIGVIYRPETERQSHYFHSRLADELDLVIHIDSTRALEPLDPIDVEESSVEPELPETYPTGV
jgi:erythromycin esterase-like protein